MWPEENATIRWLIWIKLSLGFSSFCVRNKSFYFAQFCMVFNSMKIERDLNGLNSRSGVKSRSLWEKYVWKHRLDIPLPHRQILFKSPRLGEMGMSQSKGETLLSVFFGYERIRVISQESFSKTKRLSAFKFRHVCNSAFVGKARKVCCTSQYTQTASINSIIVFDKILVMGHLLNCLILRPVTFLCFWNYKYPWEHFVFTWLNTWTLLRGYWNGRRKTNTRNVPLVIRNVREWPNVKRWYTHARTEAHTRAPTNTHTHARARARTQLYKFWTSK